MDLVEYVKENTNPLKILNHYNFREINENEHSIRACCGIHNGENNSGFIWNKENNLWFCYTGECGGGDVFDLIQKIEGISFKDSVKKAASILGLNTENMSIGERKDSVLKEQKRWMEKQKSYILNSKKKELDINYQIISDISIPDNISKRFSKDTFEFYNAKFAKEYIVDGTKMYNKLVIPIYDNSICIGFALRDTTGNFKPKWLYQPKGLKLSHTLYNYDVAEKNILENCLQEIILVEGIFDVWAYHEIGIDNVVAIFGSSISEEQYRKIMLLGTDITLSFDNDEAGNKCKEKTAKKFNNKAIINLINLPENCDPDDINRNELKGCYMNRTRLN